MTMLEDMKRFTAELDAARTGRKEDWNRIRNASDDFVMEQAATRKAVAAQTKKDLAAYHQMVLQKSNEVREQARAQISNFSKERRRMRETELAALHNDTIAFRESVAKEISEIGAQRASMGKEMMAELAKNRAIMIAEVTRQLTLSHRARMELRRHLDEMHMDWVTVAGHPMGPTSNARTRPSIAKPGAEDEVKKAGPEPEDATEEIDIEESVLRIIKKAPGGVDLKAVATSLGIKWRKTTRPAQELVAKGLVRKEGGMYYPV